jgi:hypothetical protein
MTRAVGRGAVAALFGVLWAALGSGGRAVLDWLVAHPRAKTP